MAIDTSADEIRKIFSEVDQIADAKSREGVIKIWLELAAKTARERFEDIPKNLNLEKHETLDGYIQGVTRISLTLSDITKYIHGLSVDRDLLIADCLLHEILKPMKSEPNLGGPATESSTPPAKKRSSAQRFSTVFTAPTRAGKKSAQNDGTCPSPHHPHKNEEHASGELRGLTSFLRRLGGIRGLRRRHHHGRRQAFRPQMNRKKIKRGQLTRLSPAGRPAEGSPRPSPRLQPRYQKIL
jgi:hypothetical protein